MRERPTICLVLVCDGCGREYDGSGDYKPHYDSAGAAREEAVDCSEWRTDLTSDWCWTCQGAAHAFVADPTDSGSCARCPHPEDEHEAAS